MKFRSQLENILPAKELLFSVSRSFGRYNTFLSHAVAHPAKMNTKLLEFLIKNFTKEGETVLDPMCGSGSTGVIAALCGRNVIQVDIEKKFVDWANEAKRQVEKHPTFTSKGFIRNICGDARKLSELLENADVILTSPPYSESISSRAGGKCTLERVGISTKTSRSYDAVITSPPYEDQLAFRDTEFMVETAEERSKHYRDGTSKGHFASAEAIKRTNEKLVSEYSQNPLNIGNLKKKQYSEAMLKVYAEMYKVLKQNGVAIIVIKPFIRSKKVVDLPYHTWVLLKKVGFKLTKLYKLRLKSPSFWRALYRKKYPGVPEIKHEYILVVAKLE